MKTKLQGFLKSTMFTRTLYSLGAILLMLAIFQAGVFVGFHKATFAHQFGERYYRGFDGGDRGKFGMPFRGLPDAHGATGKILSVEIDLLVIEGPEGIEKSVRLKGDTELRRFRDRIKVADLRVGDIAVVIGEPNENGEIDARFVRLLPPLPTATSLVPTEKNGTTTSPQ